MFFFLVLFSVFLPQEPIVQNQELKEGRVTRIEGALRLEITPTGSKESVRVVVAFLDGPQRGEDYYAEGERLALRLLGNRTIRYSTARTGPTRDGRTPVVIHIRPSDDYGSHLVREGLAYRDAPQKSAYEKEEKQARDERRGVWGEKKRR